MALSNTSGTFTPNSTTVTFKGQAVASGTVTGLYSTTASTTFGNWGTGWSYVPVALGPGEWCCAQCGGRFYIIDDQPEIDRTIEYMDVTTFGSPVNTKVVSGVTIKLYCSSCRP